MLSVTKPKVFALGTAISLKRLGAYDVDHDIDLVGSSSTNELLELIRREHFDVILVDILHEEASCICRYLVETNYAPVALLVREEEVNWQDLCSWAVDGFISDDSGKTEMVARITALARRCRKYQVIQA